MRRSLAECLSFAWRDAYFVCEAVTSAIPPLHFASSACCCRLGVFGACACCSRELCFGARRHLNSSVGDGASASCSEMRGLLGGEMFVGNRALHVGVFKGTGAVAESASCESQWSIIDWDAWERQETGRDRACVAGRRFHERVLRSVEMAGGSGFPGASRRGLVTGRR